MTTYSDSLAYSNKVIGTLRQQLAPNTNEDDVIVVCGSYSRREASALSDIDYFTVSPNCSDRTPEFKLRLESIEGIIKENVAKGPSEGGAFAKCHTQDEILKNIGGQNDDNDNITRRILFLLEGGWLAGEMKFRQLRRSILEKYISSSITDHQLALFLLNDVIRYYRTVCVDYEFKTAQADNPKPWAIRNVKLIFSRKLLYASGLFSVALTCDRRPDRKIEILEHLFDLPCMERLSEICGACRMIKLKDCYDRFLTCISDDQKRKHLEALEPNNRSTDPVFRDIKNEGHLFTHELQVLFNSAFSATHPIHKAVIF